MSLENLFDFFGEQENNVSGSIPSLEPSPEDTLVSRIIPQEIVSEIEALGPGYKTFLDVFLAVKGIDTFRTLDGKINNAGLNTKKSYNLQKDLELEKFYLLITRHPEDVFLDAIKKSSYKDSIQHVISILEYLISFFLVLEKYEECAEIKKYIDFLQQKS